MVWSDSFAPGNQRSGEVIEFSAIAEATLGRPLEEKAQLDAVQAELRGHQYGLIDRLQRGDITPDQYLSSFNGALKSATQKCRAILGETRFLQVFGEAGLHPEGLVDRATFMERIAADGLPKSL